MIKEVKPDKAQVAFELLCFVLSNQLSDKYTIAMKVSTARKRRAMAKKWPHYGDIIKNLMSPLGKLQGYEGLLSGNYQISDPNHLARQLAEAQYLPVPPKVALRMKDK